MQRPYHSPRAAVSAAGSFVPDREPNRETNAAPLRRQAGSRSSSRRPPREQRSPNVFPTFVYAQPGIREGEGVLLEIPGFIVDVATSLTAEASQPFPIRVKVTMTCGCPTEPGGLWNADHISVTARLLRDGSPVRELPLAYAGQTSTYEAEVPALEPGDYTVEVLASDPRAANFGRATSELLVRPRAD